jgi:hypothetical protein
VGDISDVRIMLFSEDQLLCPAVPDLEDWDVLTNGIPDGVNLATLK